MSCRSNSRISRPAALIAIGAVSLSIFSGSPAPAQAADSPAATAHGPMLDPWVPPAARKPANTVPTRDAALRAQAERKLKERFDSADPGRTGTLTREQANKAGLGFVVKHFDAIDQRNAGVVRFEDVKQFLRKRGAQLN